MEAKNLRIGNFILNKDNQVEQVKELVMELNGEYDVVSGINKIREGEIKPIRLTKEWLTKFGFVFRDSRICSPPNCWHEYEVFGNEMSDSIRMSLQSKDIVVFAIINYVHELQNLYHALTGKELSLAAA